MGINDVVELDMLHKDILVLQGAKSTLLKFVGSGAFGGQEAAAAIPALDVVIGRCVVRYDDVRRLNTPCPEGGQE